MSTHIYKIQINQIQSIQAPHLILFLKFNMNIEYGSYGPLNIILRYINNELDPSSTNFKTRLGQLIWWKEQLGHRVITNITEDLISKALEELQNTPDRYGKPRKSAALSFFPVRKKHHDIIP